MYEKFTPLERISVRLAGVRTMMGDTTTVALLIRHGHTDALGTRLVGRTPHVHLSASGRAQAERLRARLARVPLAAIYSSPLERAIETAAPLARDRDLQVQTRDELLEVDFGSWSGMTFEQLEPLAAWRAFNTHRSTTGVPHGEHALDVQARVMRALARVRADHASDTVALVSHADVIRAAVLYCAGAPLDLFDRFEISPASVTAIALGAGAPRLLYVNEQIATRCGEGPDGDTG